MEGQRGEVTCLSLHSTSVVELLIGVDIRVNPKLGLLDLSTPCSLLKNAEYLLCTRHWTRHLKGTERSETQLLALMGLGSSAGDQWKNVRLGHKGKLAECWELAHRGQRTERAGRRLARSGQASDDLWPQSTVFSRISWPWPNVGNIFYTNTLTHTHTHTKVPPDYSYLCTYLVSLRGFFFFFFILLKHI